MLLQLSDRGPDSAGVAIYRDPAPSGSSTPSWRRRPDLIVGSTTYGRIWADARAYGLSPDRSAPSSDNWRCHCESETFIASLWVICPLRSSGKRSSPTRHASSASSRTNRMPSCTAASPAAAIARS